jgi:hypothetical protein
MSHPGYHSIETEHDEIVVFNEKERGVSLTIQSKARGYDDYHMSQASTRLIPDTRDQLIAAILPEGSVVLSPEDITGLLACEGYIPLNKAVVDSKMLSFSRIWNKLKQAKTSCGYKITYDMDVM